MTDEHAQDLMNMNYRLLLLLGMVTPLLIECKNGRPRADHYKFDWFLDAVNAVVYNNKPIPPFPEKDLL